ncbi:DUF3772 domain-containing protein [Pseudooceanicola nanhaiensis]|uniref:DUF3772 domain-containing protein n=1 Tax=Pseudooceanicola nanhaiensis TaxID=375761 RepID=UPI003517E80D
MSRAASFLSLCLLTLSLVLSAPLRTAAQDTQPAPAATPAAAVEIDYAAWETFAAEAQTTIASGDATDEELEALRKELVAWRDRFEAAQSVNAEAIATTQAQIEALGPPPEDGTEEAPKIAQQRDALNAQLAELQAPVTAAEVAWNRADALIRAIDRTLRERSTSRLLERGPAPLNPLNWPEALASLADGFEALWDEAATRFGDPEVRDAVREHLPIALLLFAVGLLLILRGRWWIEKLTLRVLGNERSAQRYIAGFVISLGQVVLPVVGTIALLTAIIILGAAGAKLTALLQVIPGAVIAFAVARWVGVSIFPIGDVPPPPLRLSSQARLEGRVHSTFLGLIMGIYILLKEFGEAEDWSGASLNVVLYPLIVVAGVMLFRVARLILSHSEALSEDDAAVSFGRQLMHLLARFVILVAIVGPLLAGIGYFNAGYAIVFPTIFSLQLLGVIVILQRVATEIYVLATRNSEGARDALVPVLMGFLLMVASVPIFAIIWGARLTDITEMWNRFVTGFTFGDITISPSIFLTAIIVLILGVFATRLVQSTLRTTILPKTKMDPGAQAAIVSGLGYVGIFFAGLIAIMAAGIDLSALGYVAGALSVGIGFGLQNIVSNFVSGIILLIERPVSEGDWIEVGPNMGYVRSISVRSTRIETFDRQDVIVPNADLISGTVTNWTRGNLVGRLILPVGVAYGTDTRRVERILKEIAEAQPIVLLNPPPYVFFKGFGASSLDFEVRAILRDINQMLAVQTEMNHQIAERFAQEGIEIPFPQQDLWLRNPEALTGTARTETLTPGELRDVAEAQRGSQAHLDESDTDAGPDDADGDAR